MQSQIIRPGAGVASAGGRKTGKLQRSQRGRVRALKADMDKLIRRTAKERGWKATPDFRISAEDQAYLAHEMAVLRDKWLPHGLID